MEQKHNPQPQHHRLMLSERVLARWRRLVAHRDGHPNSQQSGFILHRRTVCCRPGGRRGNTERVVTRWRRLAASIKALDLLHRAMRAVSHHRTAMAIAIDSDGGAFVCRRHLFRLL